MTVDVWFAAPMCILCVLAGLALGLWWGESRTNEMLKNMLAYGSPWRPKGGQTIRPETAEVRLDRDARAIEMEYTEATIKQGIADLGALYVSEGRARPTDEELRKEVEDMLSRAGTPEAGVPSA